MTYDPTNPDAYTPEQIAAYKDDNERRVREAALRGDAHVDGLPLKVTLELTADCNFFCRMCEFPAPREAGRRAGYELSVPLEEFESLVAPQVFPHALVVNLTVVGEPLLVPYLDRVLELAGKWQTKIEFITHGQFLDQAMIEKIGPRAAGVVISFDGGTRTTFNRIRTGGDFDVITRNMLLFQRWREALPKDAYVPYLHMNATLMRENINELPVMVRVAHALGVDLFNGALMIAFNEKMAKSSLLNHRALANKAFLRAREVAEELGQPAVFPAPFPKVSEQELSSVTLDEPELPDGPLPHLREMLAGGEAPDITPRPARPDESFHEVGANIPEGARGGLYEPLAEVGGFSQAEAARESQEVLAEQAAFNRERAFGSPLQQTADKERQQAKAASAARSPEPRKATVRAPGAAEPPTEGARYTCKFLWNELFIGLQGDVAPCCIQGRPVVGNIKEQDLASIWNGPLMKEMRERLMEGDPIPCCKDCNYNTQIGHGDYREDTFIITERAQRVKRLKRARHD